MHICFIPHSVISAQLSPFPHAVLDKLCELTGATAATYHKEELWYIKLHNPTITVSEVRDMYANSFAKCDPVWTE